MKRMPVLTTTRKVQLYWQAIRVRREFCSDVDFVKMTHVWGELLTPEEGWSINKFQSGYGEDYVRRAAVVALGHGVRLTVDDELWTRAERGEEIPNYILAHELGHLIMGHHARNAVSKNFQLFSGPRGMSNIPPTAEELEANLVAVFLQCGPALENPMWETRYLAKRAFAPFSEVRAAQKLVCGEPFQKELQRVRSLNLVSQYPREVF